VLGDWPYDPEHNVRVLKGPDGRRVLQVRVEQGAFQGILQMNLDGRPDGNRPHDSDFLLDHLQHEHQEYRAEHGMDKGFALTHEQCEELFDESRRVYERYIFLLQLGDYERVIRDTERNMAVFRFVNRYASDEADRNNLEKWWPYILRIHAQARALTAMQEGELGRALDIVKETLDRVQKLPEVDAEEFGYERTRSIQALRDMAAELRKKQPLTPEQRLERELQKAINEERFEQAAVLRDRLRAVRQCESHPA